MTNTDKEILDILKGFMSDDEIKDAIEKGNIKLGAEESIEKGGKKEDSEETEVNVTVEEGDESEEKKEEDEDEDEKKSKDVEKGYDKVEKSEETSKEANKEEDLEKSQDNDIMKAMNEKFEGIDEKFQEVDELKKSINGLTEMLSGMSTKIDNISNEAPEPKSVRNVQYFEKGGAMKDEEDRTVLSATNNKEKLGEEMLKSIGEETDSIMKSQIESDLMNVIAGNSMPSESVSKYMYEKRGVRITK